METATTKTATTTPTTSTQAATVQTPIGGKKGKGALYRVGKIADGKMVYAVVKGEAAEAKFDRWSTDVREASVMQRRDAVVQSWALEGDGGEKTLVLLVRAAPNENEVTMARIRLLESENVRLRAELAAKKNGGK